MAGQSFSEVRAVQARSLILNDHRFGIEKPEDWLSRSEEEQKGMICSILEEFEGRPIRANNQMRLSITEEDIERQKKEIREATEKYDASKARIEWRDKEERIEARIEKATKDMRDLYKVAPKGIDGHLPKWLYLDTETGCVWFGIPDCIK